MHIFLLGGGVMQVPAVKAARQMGWRITMADGNGSCLARPLVDTFLHVDLRDRPGLLAAARACSPSIDGVFTAGTDFSTSVAFVSEAMGLPGIPYAAALNATDKDRMRNVLRSAGVPVPDHVPLTHEAGPAELEALVKRLGFPVVVKPVDNMGARGVRRVDIPEELPGAVDAARRSSGTDRCLIESFLDGPEFSLDALVFDGEVHVTGVADRHIYFPPYFVEMGHTMPTEAGMEERRALEAVFERAIDALGISHGSAKGDIFLTERGAVVGEVAARLSGGYMSGWTFPNAYGINVTKAALRLAVGERPGPFALEPSRNEWSAERALVSAPGIVEAVDNRAGTLPGITDVFVKVTPGDAVTLPTNNVEKVANVISRMPDREGAVSVALDALHLIDVDLRVGVPETEEFVFGHGATSPFRPYGLTGNQIDAILAVTGEVDSVVERLLSGGPLPVTDRVSAVRPRYPTPPPGGVFAHLVQESLIVVSEPGLDGAFWRTFLAAGRQGVRYLARTVAHHRAHGTLPTWARRWLWPTAP